MSERLTDRDLKRLDVPGIGDDVRMLARELIERRAADLTTEEREALKYLRGCAMAESPDGFDRAACVTCGESLPLGPANDDVERVRVEVRAAELAHHDFDCADFTQSEWMGWNGDEEYIMCGQFRNVFDDMSEERFAGWEAGVLAAAIAAHDGGE